MTLLCCCFGMKKLSPEKNNDEDASKAIRSIAHETEIPEKIIEGKVDNINIDSICRPRVVEQARIIITGVKCLDV